MLDYKEIGKRIRLLRRKQNLSQEQLAEKVWISTTHMSHIETGTTKLSLPVLVDLAGALGVGTDRILGLQEDSVKTDAAQNIQRILSQCTPQQAKHMEEILLKIQALLED